MFYSSKRNPTAPQLPAIAGMFCSKFDCEAIGSPQPPPGGGLLLSVAGPSARLRAGQNEIDPAGIGGPQPTAAKARNSCPAGPLVRFLRRLQPGAAPYCPADALRSLSILFFRPRTVFPTCPGPLIPAMPGGIMPRSSRLRRRSCRLTAAPVSPRCTVRAAPRENALSRPR